MIRTLRGSPKGAGRHPLPSEERSSPTAERWRVGFQGVHARLCAAASENAGVAQVVLEHLSKTFRGGREQEVCAVSDLSLTVEAGELLVLTGASGCGKSTTLRLIAGLEEPTSGSIHIGGRNMQGVEPKDREVAMVFQSPALYPHMTAGENLAFGLAVRKVPEPEIRTRVREAARALGLEECLERRPEALSGGERQRVSLGRALVRQPKVLLLDEPLASLDAPLRAQLRAQILDLHRRFPTTMLYVTHDQAEAMTMGTRLAVLRQGCLQQVASPLEVYERPANLFVAGFIGSPAMNFFRGTVSQEGGELFVRDTAGLRLTLAVGPGAGARLKDWTGKEVVIGLRPEHLRVIATGSGDGERPGFEGGIESVETTGVETYLRVRWGAGQSWVVRAEAGARWSIGQPVRVGFDANRTYFFDALTEQAIGG